MVERWRLIVLLSVFLSLAAIVATLVLVEPARSLPAVEKTIESKLLAADGAAGDHFGYCVAMDGDTAVAGAFCDDDNTVAPAYFSPFVKHITHLGFPLVYIWRGFGDKSPVRSRSQGAHQGQVATAPAHHFHYKCTLVTGSCARYRINSFDNSV